MQILFLFGRHWLFSNKYSAWKRIICNHRYSTLRRWIIPPKISKVFDCYQTCRNQIRETTWAFRQVQLLLLYRSLDLTYQMACIVLNSQWKSDTLFWTLPKIARNRPKSSGIAQNRPKLPGFRPFSSEIAWKTSKNVWNRPNFDRK